MVICESTRARKKGKDVIASVERLSIPKRYTLLWRLVRRIYVRYIIMKDRKPVI